MTSLLIPLVMLLVLAAIVAWRGGSVPFYLGLLANVMSLLVCMIWQAQEPYQFCGASPSLFLGMCMCSFLFPLSKLRPDGHVFMRLDAVRVRFFAWIVIVLTIPATLYFLQYIDRIFASDISSLRLENRADSGNVQGGLHRVFVTSAYFYMLALAFFVYGVVRKGLSRIQLLLLLAGSLSYPLSGIYLYSRGMTVLYGATFFAFFVMAFPFCDSSLKRKLVRGFLFVVILTGIPFAYITVERFGDNKHQGFFEYVGGGPRFFARIFYHRDEWVRDPSALFLRPFSMAVDFSGERTPPHERALEVFAENKLITYAEEDITEPSSPFVTFCGTLLAEFPLWIVAGAHLFLCVGFFRFFSNPKAEVTLARFMLSAMYFSSALLYPIGYMYVGTPGNCALMIILVMAFVLGPTAVNENSRGERE